MATGASSSVVAKQLTRKRGKEQRGMLVEHFVLPLSLDDLQQIDIIFGGHIHTIA